MTREEEILRASSELQWGFVDGTNDMEFFDTAFVMGARWADDHPHWISAEQMLPPRSELNEKISEAVITFAYYGDGPHFLVELNRYHYGDGQWLYSNAKYWMPFRFPKKGDEK